jgi:ABC-2 type transport system ATP-binding protein
MVNAIEVKQLTKKFGTLNAVDNISFEVGKGEFFGFLGPNGAGKTTTIRILTGIIQATSGRVSVMGYDIGSHTLNAKKIMGIIPEVANAYMDLSGWINMMFQGELYGLHRGELYDLSKELLVDFDLYDRKDQKVKFYSKGMQQRLIICMALLNRPEILFLDEPTSGLDVSSTFMIREKIRDINSKGTTIFLTTHNMEEASQMCERIGIINKGRIAAINSPEKLKLTVKKLQSIIVAFDRDTEQGSIYNLPGVREVKKIGDKMRIFTEIPGELVFHLVDFARENSLKILTLNTLTPSLEDVFLKITEESTG